MLQVKDPQEVFDENIRPLFEQAAKDLRQELDEEDLNTPYSIFVLGEMYGTISTCLAQNIPIPKEMWDIPVVQSFVRGDVDDVVVVDEINDTIQAKMPHCGIGIINTEPLVNEPNGTIENTKETYEDVVERMKAKGVIPPSPIPVENKGLIILP